MDGQQRGLEQFCRCSSWILNPVLCSSTIPIARELLDAGVPYDAVRQQSGNKKLSRCSVRVYTGLSGTSVVISPKKVFDIPSMATHCSIQMNISEV